MSLTNASIVIAPSSIAATGGSALAFSSSGQAGNTVTLYVAADTDLRTRRTIDVEVRKPRPNASAPNGLTQARQIATFKKPKVLANGKITTGTVSVTLAYDVEFTQTEIQELIDVGAQMLCDSDFTNLWKASSLS